MISIRRLCVPAAGVLLSLVIACGGDSDKPAVPESTPASGSATSTSQQGSAPGTSIPSSIATSGGIAGGGSANSLDLAATTNRLQTLKSFNFDMALKLDFKMPTPTAGSGNEGMDAFGAALFGLFSDLKFEGSFVGPDSYHVRTTLFGQKLEYITIGSKSWVKEGNSAWKVDDGSDPMDFSDFASPDGFLGEFLPAEVLKAAKTSRETVNGVQTTRYTFDKASLQALAKELGEEEDLGEIDSMALDVWLTSDNIPVKILMEAAGKSEGQPISMKLEMNVRDLNSSSIQIKAPI